MNRTAAAESGSDGGNGFGRGRSSKGKRVVSGTSVCVASTVDTADEMSERRRATSAGEGRGRVWSSWVRRVLRTLPIGGVRP